MVRTKRPATPEERIRDLRKELRAFDSEPPSAQRAARLALFTRAAHEDRQLNMAMHTASMCLEDDPDAPSLLVEAYTSRGDHEDRLSALGDLRDLGRYIERPDIRAVAEERLRETALDWVTAASDGERRYRLRTVQSLTSREVADSIRDELSYQS